MLLFLRHAFLVIMYRHYMAYLAFLTIVLTHLMRYNICIIKEYKTVRHENRSVYFSVIGVNLWVVM